VRRSKVFKTGVNMKTKIQKIEYDITTIPHGFTKEVFIPEGEEIELSIKGDVSHDVSYTITAKLAKNASLVVNDSIKTTANCIIRFVALLDGSGASVRDTSRYWGKNTAMFDIERTVTHKAEHTVSHLQARGVTEDSAHAIWRGRIHIEKSAQKAQAFQRHNALLVGEHAHIDASPVLEVFANDVTCKHSASIQRINSESLFYCMSRGSSKAEAHKQLSGGFLV
jgi:Fe-S cluster assembly scaffold protein SufB